MARRLFTAAVVAAFAMGPFQCAAQGEGSGADLISESGHAAVEYLPLGAPLGMSQAVRVQGVPLVHTRQLLPVNAAGELVGEDSVEEQIDQVLSNVDAVLQACGSNLNQLVRLNVYALSPATVMQVRQRLHQRVGPAVRPAITSVLTPLTRRGAVVAVDAVAAGDGSATDVITKQCEAVNSTEARADAAILPAGGVAYLSGQPDEGTLVESAVDRSVSKLMKTLEHLQLSPDQVIQIKVFVQPVTSSDEVIEILQKYFPDQLLPPIVFVEWLAKVPVEIEMIARFSSSAEPAAELEYYTPPEVRPSHTFSRVALVHSGRQIYISGLYSIVPSRGDTQAILVFDQLQDVLAKSGSDMRHLAKAMYYVSDDDAARWVDRTRPEVFDPNRPPAASKVMVHGVGMLGRTMTVDMIAVPSE